MQKLNQRKLRTNLLKKLSYSKQIFAAILLIVVFAGVWFYVNGCKTDTIPALKVLTTLKPSDSLTLERGDLIVRPNNNLLPWSAKVESGRVFGHMAIVVKGSRGQTVDDALREARVVEIFVFDQTNRKFVFKTEKASP